MFGVSMWEVTLILLVALIALGPKQMIEVARAVGKLYGELQKFLTEARHSIDLDALMSDTHNHPKPLPNASPDGSSSPDHDLGPHTEGAKSGPDFYADLLANSQKNGVLADQAAQPKAKMDDRPDAAPHESETQEKSGKENTKTDSK